MGFSFVLLVHAISSNLDVRKPWPDLLPIFCKSSYKESGEPVHRLPSFVLLFHALSSNLDARKPWPDLLRRPVGVP